MILFIGSALLFYPAHLLSWLFDSAPGYAFINWADNETPTEQHSELDFTDTVGQSATLTLTNTVALGITASMTVGVPDEMSATFSVIEPDRIHGF